MDVTFKTRNYKTDQNCMVSPTAICFSLDLWTFPTKYTLLIVRRIAVDVNEQTAPGVVIVLREINTQKLESFDLHG